MEEKSVLDWLSEAEKRGYTWANDAIKNYDPNYKEKNLPIFSLRGALEAAFDWEYTPEGYKFWRDVQHSIPKNSIPSKEHLAAGEKLRAILLEDSLLPKPYPKESLYKLATRYEMIEDKLDAQPSFADSLREPYRTTVIDAVRASYEEELEELRNKMLSYLGVEVLHKPAKTSQDDSKSLNTL